MKKSIIIYLLFFPNLIFTQNVFDLGVRNIEIFFSEVHWDDTLDLYYSNGNGQRLVADSIIIDGEVDQNVGIKYKGNSSYNINNGKNPMNIRLDYINNGQSIDGYNVLKLSNGFKDPTFVREMLSYKIAQEFMPAPKATYANVSVNGVLVGLYVCVQSVDDDFTNENFYERKGPFFKAENTGINIPNCSGPLRVWDHYLDTLCYQRAYEMQSSNDWTKLSHFLDTVNNHFTHIENVLDIDRTLWMMAFENLLVCLDGPINSIPHNFYLFQDNNGRFSPIMWDMNQSFGTFTNGLPTPVNNQDLQQLDIFHGASNNLNIMNMKMFSVDQYKRMYVAHMKTIINDYFVNGEYISIISDLQQLIDSYVSTDPNLFFPYSAFSANVNSSIGSNIGITELMDSRINHLQSLPEFSANPPIIDNLSSNPISVLPHSSVSITSNISNADYAYLGYRFKFADKFEKVQMFDDGNNGDGIAGDGIYGATINVDARDIQYYIYAENSDAGIFSPQRAEHDFHQIPVISGLVINEVMAANFSKVADQDGEYDDWVELYNGGANDINLTGFYLSDNENILNKWMFPNITIASNDYLIIWCDTAGTTQSGLHTTYRLSADQEEVYLIDPSGTVLDAVHFVNMPVDLSYSRVPNGSGPFVYQEPTYDMANSSILSNNNIKTKGSFNIYPNPTTDILYFSGLEESVTIFNNLGQIVFYSSKMLKALDVGKFEKGIYFVRSGNKTVKFLKQ
ncbi:MAG: hypothetical protein CMD34_02660 [Flavobacteriales bacterium]|nr:hypothetical protein [Flavobacteriales bacterium]